MKAIEIFTRMAIPAMWTAWILYWLIAARSVKRTRWQEPITANALHGIPLLLCLILLVTPRWLPAMLSARVVPPGPVLPLVGALSVAGGLAFAVWARIELGDNWSSRVVIKEDHALVCGGPYRWVRHPIYSGLLLAVAGTALAIGEWRGVLALGFAAIGILLRVRSEEIQMALTFPAYEKYRRQTPALIPFVL